MTKHIRLVGSIVAMTLATLGQTARADEPARPRVTVILYDYAAVPAELLSGARDRVTRIYRHAGLDIAWIDPPADPSAPAVNPDANAFGTFTVQMIIRSSLAESGIGVVYGEIHERSGSAFVSFERVNQVALLRQQGAAEVLGYALAHEMGHLLLPIPSHSRIGIMRPGWDAGDFRHIEAGVMLFTPSQARLIRTKVSACCRLP